MGQISRPATVSIQLFGADKKMSIEHKARSGKTYYLHVTPGPNGKAKHFFSTKPEASLAQAIPDGYEIFENVNAQVFLIRKITPLIRDDEISLIQFALKKHAEEWKYKAEIKKNMIVIHEACQEYDWLHLLPHWGDKSKLEQIKIQNTNYMPIMRFVLEDKESRIFRAERYCFKGSIDDWIFVGLPNKLNVLARKLVKHLGQESFYELM